MTFLTKNILSTLAIIGFLAGPATGQDHVDSAAGANLIAPLQINKVDDLYFGVIAPSLTTASTVQVLRSELNMSICGAELTCFEPGNRSQFVITGEANKFVTLSNPGSITVSNENGDTMVVDSFVGGGAADDTYWGGRRLIESDGSVGFKIGAKLYVGANQPIGAYTGTFTITAEYE